MRKRNFIHTCEELLENGRGIISSSAENKFIFRVIMVNLLLSGKISAAELSRPSEVPERTLRTRVRFADEEGFGPGRTHERPNLYPMKLRIFL